MNRQAGPHHLARVLRRCKPWILLLALSPVFAVLPVAGEVGTKRISLNVHEMWLPVRAADPATPETRTLTPEEADAALRRDWLFQAMGEPLWERTQDEIGWTRELVDRLSRKSPALDFSAELTKLASLERSLAGISRSSVPAVAPDRVQAVPSWIWYPEGQPARGAPDGERYFRRVFDMPAVENVRGAELRVAADDACEVFLNGVRVGRHETWQNTAVLDVGKLLKRGRNVLAIRAENRPARSANPAGLIARLTIKLANSAPLVVVSDGSWRTGNKQEDGWAKADFVDQAWPEARIAASFGDRPWGKIRGLTNSD